MTEFTMSLRLCDDHGMVNEQPIPDGPAGYTYRGRHNHLAGMAGLPLVTEDFACTGSAHLAHEHIRCTSPAHGLPNHYCSRMRDGRCAVCGRSMDTTADNEKTFEQWAMRQPLKDVLAMAKEYQNCLNALRQVGYLDDTYPLSTTVEYLIRAGYLRPHYQNVSEAQEYLRSHPDPSLTTSDARVFRT